MADQDDDKPFGNDSLLNEAAAANVSGDQVKAHGLESRMTSGQVDRYTEEDGEGYGMPGPDDIRRMTTGKRDAENYGDVYVMSDAERDRNSAAEEAAQNEAIDHARNNRSPQSIDDVTDLATSTPEEAAENISNANLLNVDPRYAAQNKDVIGKSADKLLQPQEAEAPVADYMRQSSEHAALAKPDVDHLSWMAKQAKMISDYVFDRPTTEHAIVDLNLKKMNQGGVLSQDDEIALMSANQDAADQSERNYGLDGPLNKIPAWIAGSISDMGQSLVRGARKGLMDASTSFISKPSGAIASIYYGTMIKDPYDTLAAGTYNELGKITGPDGQPKNLDHDTKLAYSRAVGIVGTGLMNMAGPVLAETAPFLKPLMNPVLASGLINTPAKAATMIALGNAIKGAGTMAAQSGLTEVAKIVAEEMGKNHGTDEAGFWNSLATAATRANAIRAGEAAAGGAATGLAMELPIQAFGFSANRKAFQSALNDRINRSQAPVRDVTPETPIQIGESHKPSVDDVIDLTPSEGGGGDPLEKSYKVLQLNEALHNINDVQKSTNMNGVAPGELNEVNKKNFMSAGMDKFYATADSIKEWATSDDKQRKARMLIDPSGVAANQLNAPAEVQAHDVMEVAKEYPDILDHIQYSPDTPNAMTAKQHIEAMQKAEGDRAELMKKLGIKPQDVQQDNVTQMPERESKPVQPKDFFADAKRTQEISDEKKKIVDDAHALPEGVEPTEHEQKIAKLDKELEGIKARVTQALTENPPGSVLAFPYDEQQAALKAEMSYGRAPTFTEAISKVLRPEQVAKFNGAQLRARMNVSELIHDAAVHEMNQVVDQTTEMAKEEARRAELERIAHDPNYAVIDKFQMHQIANAKGKNKQSIYAVDPKSLSDDLLKYVDHPQLKSHKVFVKGGNNIEDSARALGFGTGKDMLETMAKTPTREQIIKARSQFYTSDIERLAKAGIDLDNTNIMKAFNDRTQAHLEEMKFLKEQEWSSVKYGIKKIALPLPRMADIEHDARTAVQQMKIGSLTPAQFVVGERQSQAIAIHSILENDVEKAFQAKEMAARNSAMQKEVRKAIADVNRAQKFFSVLEEPTAQEILRAAGKTHSNAIDEIIDNFNFNPKRKNQSEQGSFSKWVKRELESGRGDFSIPDRLTDIRQSIDEMTPEQVAAAYDRAKTIFSEAKYKAELIENRDLREEERSIDRIAELIQKAAELHPGSSMDNIPPTQDTKTTFQAMRQFVQSTENLFTNMEHTLRYLDQGKFNGPFSRVFMRPLKGDGEFLNKSGFTKESQMMRRFAEQYRQISDNHGSLDDIEKKIFAIPEFKGIQGLNYGQLTKGDLMVALAYKGDPQGREKLQKNFTDKDGKATSLETWQKVLDRELDEKDAIAVQNIVDMYKQYQQETRDLQNRTKGEDVVFIKGVPNEHRGKFLPGGYVPNKHKNQYSAEAAKRTLQFMEQKRAAWYEKEDGADYGRQYAAETTEQGRLVERTDNNKPLDLSFIRFLRGHEEIIHDLSYREPVMNNLKLLKDKRIRDAIVTMGGQGKYNLIVNSVIEIAGRAEAMNANYFSDQNNYMKQMFAHFQQGFTTTVLGLNLTSVMVQYEELTQLMQNVGKNGMKHFGKSVALLTTHPHLWGAFHDFAAELDPTIGNAQANIQNKITSTVHALVPQKRNKYLGPIRASSEWMTNKMLAPMGFADMHDKMIGAMTAYSQFMSGDADNWPIERVQALTEDQRHKQAQAYVAQLSRLSLMHGRPEDQAPFQKNPAAKFFANYWNFFRNVLNNQFSQGRKIKWNLQAGRNGGSIGGGSGGGSLPPGAGDSSGIHDDFKNDYKGSYGQAAAAAAFMVVIASVGRWYSSKLRGEDDTPDQWNVDLRSAKGIAEASKRAGEYMMFSPMEQAMTASPIVRDIFHAATQRDKVIRGYVDKEKVVQLPMTKMMSDIATAAHTIKDGYDQANNLIDFLQYMGSRDNKETGALLRTSSYVGVPWPVNAYSKFMRWSGTPMSSPMQAGPAVYEKLHDTIGQFRANPPKDLDPKFDQELHAIQLQIAPKAVSVPDGMTDTMKYAMSGADWSKPDGIYGFSKDQWNQIKTSEPSLGLTDSGRISKNTEQQEKAMDWFLHRATEKLAENDVKVDKGALLGAFKIGASKYIDIAKAPNDTKIKTILSGEDLAKNPEFLDFKTVGQLKKYFDTEANKAHVHAQGPTAQLTPTTLKPEDKL